MKFLVAFVLLFAFVAGREIALSKVEEECVEETGFNKEHALKAKVEQKLDGDLETAKKYNLCYFKKRHWVTADNEFDWDNFKKDFTQGTKDRLKIDEEKAKEAANFAVQECKDFSKTLSVEDAVFEVARCVIKATRKWKENNQN